MDIRDIISEIGIASQEELAGIPTGEDLVNRVAEIKSISGDEILFAIGEKLGVPYVRLSTESIDPDVAKLIPAEVCRNHCIFPILAEEGEITVVFADPTDPLAEGDIVTVTGRKVSKAIGNRGDISRCIDAIWGKPRVVPSSLAGGKFEELPTELVEDRSGITFVYFHLTQAVEEGAEEILIGPSTGAARVNYRVEGELISKGEVPFELLTGVASRIRIMAGMEFPEKPDFQRGRLKTEILGNPILIEVYIAPLMNGESIVLKLLDIADGSGVLPAEVMKSLKAKSGIGILCGGDVSIVPIISELCDGSRKVGIVSPRTRGWEYMELCSAIDLSVLESGHHPALSIISEIFDVIVWDDYPEPELVKQFFVMSGDRDLVIFRLPLPSSLRGMEYLREIGLPPVVIASSLLFITAEESFPKLCTHCRKEAPDREGPRRFVPSGCENCGGKGFVGSLKLSETLVVSDEIEEALLSGVPYQILKEVAERSGFRPISSAASELASLGEIYLDTL